jgi:CBS domain-containing protein
MVYLGPVTSRREAEMSGYIMIRRREVPRTGPRLTGRPVAGVMSPAIVTITRDLSLGDALEAMVRAGTRHLAVVDGAGRCVGVLSDREVAATFANDPSALAWRRAQDVLDPTPVLVRQKATVAEAARVMCAAGVDAVAVVDTETRPVGMVTAANLVALLATGT